MDKLDTILDLLEKHRQRATYGAVAGLLGRPHRSLMKGRPMDRRHSWIVNKATGRPTNYLERLVHPALTERPRVISSAAELEAWLTFRSTALTRRSS